MARKIIRVAMSPDDVIENFKEFRWRTAYPLQPNIGTIDLMEFQGTYLAINVCSPRTGITAFPAFVLEAIQRGENIVLWFKQGSLQPIYEARSCLVNYLNRSRIEIDSVHNGRPPFGLVRLARRRIIHA